MYQQLFGLQEEIFKTIANQKRLEIIQLLHHQELAVSEMTQMLGIRQANISQHLADLRRVRIVMARREGTKVYYRLVDNRIADACTLIKQFLQAQYNIEPGMAKLLNNESTMFPVVKDVVCGMRISVQHAGGVSEYRQNHYYFCASGCQQQFESNPKAFIKEE